MSDAAEIVKRMFEAVAKDDIPTVMGCIHEDVEVVEPVSLAYGGVHRGVKAFGENVLGAILARMTMSVGRFELIGNDNVVAASMDMTFTSRRTGRSLVMPYVELYTVKNAKVTRIDVYPQDTQRLAQFWVEN